MACDCPFGSVWELSRDPARRIHVDNREIKGRLQQYAQDAALSTLLHERCIRFGLHFATRIEHEPGHRIVRHERNVAARERAHLDTVGSTVFVGNSCQRDIVGMGIIVHVPNGCGDEHHNYHGERYEDALDNRVPFPSHVLVPCSFVLGTQCYSRSSSSFSMTSPFLMYMRGTRLLTAHTSS